jgi:hypothetical protein
MSGSVMPHPGAYLCDPGSEKEQLITARIEAELASNHAPPRQKLSPRTTRHRPDRDHDDLGGGVR